MILLTEVIAKFSSISRSKTSRKINMNAIVRAVAALIAEIVVLEGPDLILAINLAKLKLSNFILG